MENSLKGMSPCMPTTPLIRVDCYIDGVIGPISFAAPWVLLGLALLLLVPQGRGRWMRVAALALLLVGLAQPRLAGPGSRVAVLVDVSASVGDAARTAAAAFDFQGLREPPTIYQFAGDTTAVTDAQQTSPLELDTSETDLSRALQVAAAEGAQRLLIISDGAESRGSALTSLPGIPVDTLAVAPRANTRLADLIAPQRATPGETVEVVAVVESDVATTVTLRPTVGGVEREPVTREIPAGRSSIPFRFQVEADQGFEVRAMLEAGYRQPVADDEQTVEIGVRNTDPVLVLGDPAFARLLRTQGFAVVEGASADVTTPLAYSAIVVRESAGNFTPGQLELLRGYVERGGGLLMSGGPESFGFGAWYRTPVEEVLPVGTDLRTEVSIPLVALVIVVDRSQSMSTGSPSKIDLAKEGAISVVELAYQDDLLGMVVFSDAEAADWVFRPRQATERGKREMFQAILGIDTSGGTVLEPAYRMALEELARTEAAVKHVIVLSDGKLYDGQGPFATGGNVDFAAIAVAGLEQGITTSTIAVGDAADFARMEGIARSGGGRYYQALDVTTLPQIFTNEALTATRSLLRENDVLPRVRSHPLLAGDIQPPPIDAYIATTLKTDAEMLLEASDGEPLLAVRRQGLGRTAALTTDLNGWAGAFGGWDGLPAVLGTVTRWLQSRPAEYAAQVEREGDRLRIVVDAVKDGAYLNGRALEARFDGALVSLEQIAPGRYEGRLPAADGRGTLLVTEGGEVVARTRVSSPSPEFTTAGGPALLAELAERSGGEVLAEPGRYTMAGPGGRTDLWPLLAVAGLMVFMAELIWRRFGRNEQTA